MKSVKQITWKYLAIILVVALGGISGAISFAIHSIHTDSLRHEAHERKLISHDLSDLINFHKNIVHNLSETETVKNILLFSDTESAVLWAKNTRHLLPQSIGVALIDAEGNVLGEPADLLVGNQCITDLKDILIGSEVGQPPVHQENPKLRHFDIVQPVILDDEQIGLLFVSFSLDVIQQRADTRTAKGHYFQINDSKGNQIAVSGSASSMVHATQEPLWNQIPDTDWKMHYRGKQGSTNYLFVITVIVGVIIFIMTILITLVLVNRLVHYFRVDLDFIKNSLQAAHSGNVAITTDIPSNLSETVEIMDEVNYLVSEIMNANERLKQLSMNDALTGLLNRRAFDERLIQAYELSGRGIISRLILFDIDYFKQVNDKYGHGIGDDVLRIFSETLKQKCRFTDTVARLGGDEFAAILIGGDDLAALLNDEISFNLEKWFNELDSIFVKKQSELNNGKGLEPNCRVSAGSILIQKDENTNVQYVVKKADKLLYQAKNAGRASIQYE